jgi:uncharacterized protein
MNVNVPLPKQETPAEQGLSIVDCDIHPAPKTVEELFPFMAKRWQDHLKTFGSHIRQGLADALAHPRMTPDVARVDAWPEDGSTPGSDPEFMRKHHLDANGVEYGILIPLGRSGSHQRNVDYGAALCSAVNDWQIQKYCEFDKRIRASITATQEDPAAAVAEINKRAKDKRFVQVMIPPRAVDPLGRRRYWPIYEAAVANGLPIGLHLGGMGGHPSTGSGMGSYYIEEHTSNVQTMQSLITSLVIEGVFEAFPDSEDAADRGRVCLGAGAQLAARQALEALQGRSAASEARAVGICARAYPLHDAADRRAGESARHAPRHRLVGVDRLFFSTDYPHWDFDDPRYALNNAGLSVAEKQQIMSGNAKAFYGLQ